MAGHSHFANIARKKAVIDNKRGKLWSKLSKGIIVAAKHGGGDPDANLKLRYAIDAAKAVSMPKDNIIRAIKAGTGELEGGNLEEVIYEGYGPGSTAIMLEILTNNRNRTAPEVRKIFELNGGNMSGSVAWMFERKGLITILTDKIPEDALLEIALEAGADDVKQSGEVYEVICPPDSFQSVRDALAAKNVSCESADITRIPANTVDLDAESGAQMLKLIEKLDDHDDVQNVYSNFSISDEVMAQLTDG